MGDGKWNMLNGIWKTRSAKFFQSDVNNKRVKPEVLLKELWKSSRSEERSEEQ